MIRQWPITMCKGVIVDEIDNVVHRFIRFSLYYILKGHKQKDELIHLCEVRVNQQLKTVVSFRWDCEICCRERWIVKLLVGWSDTFNIYSCYTTFFQKRFCFKALMLPLIAHIDWLILPLNIKQCVFIV